MKIEQYLKDFKYADEIILQSKVYANLPKPFLALKSTWEKIKDKIQAYMRNLPAKERKDFFDAIGNRGQFTGVEEFFVKSCWGWKPSGRTVKFTETNRLGQHCFGAMFTSAKHQWPMHKELPYLPLIQIDLDKASTLIGANVGSGFLQLYQAPMIDEIDSDDWYMLRQIPRKEISKKLLTELPTFSEEQKSKINKEYIYPDFEGLFGDSSESIFIEKFNIKSFCFNCSLTNRSDEELFSAIAEGFPELHEKLIGEIEKYNVLLEKFRDSVDMSYDDDDDDDTTLFGFHSPIQELAGELDSPIMVFGAFRHRISEWTADNRTDIYGDGSGAIFVKFKKNKTPVHYFNGSR